MKHSNGDLGEEGNNVQTDSQSIGCNIDCHWTRVDEFKICEEVVLCTFVDNGLM